MKICIVHVKRAVNEIGEFQSTLLSFLDRVPSEQESAALFYNPTESV